MHGTPTVAFDGTGGITESIIDGESGYLADDLDDFVRLTRRLLLDRSERDRLGKGAEAFAEGFTWDATVVRWDRAIADAVSGAAVV